VLRCRLQFSILLYQWHIVVVLTQCKGLIEEFAWVLGVTIMSAADTAVVTRTDDALSVL
jgi:hypothetical protein